MSRERERELIKVGLEVERLRLEIVRMPQVARHLQRKLDTRGLRLHHDQGAINLAHHETEACKRGERTTEDVATLLGVR
jgi:hypothetical protein